MSLEEVDPYVVIAQRGRRAFDVTLVTHEDGGQPAIIRQGRARTRWGAERLARRELEEERSRRRWAGSSRVVIR